MVGCVKGNWKKKPTETHFGWGSDASSLAKMGASLVQVLDIPNEIKVGYSPIGFVRCGRAACRVSALKWKMGKERFGGRGRLVGFGIAFGSAGLLNRYMLPI